MSRKKTPKKTSRRSAIVPRAVFSVALAMVSVPALSGCGGRPTMSVAAIDLGFSVAAPRDSGADSATDGGATDGARDFGFSVAAPIDMGPPDLRFSVALPLDSGTDFGAFTVAAFPDAFLGVAALPPDAGV